MYVCVQKKVLMNKRNLQSLFIVRVVNWIVPYGNKVQWGA